ELAPRVLELCAVDVRGVEKPGLGDTLSLGIEIHVVAHSRVAGRACDTPSKDVGTGKISPVFVRVAFNDCLTSKLVDAMSYEMERRRLIPIRPHDRDGILRRRPARRSREAARMWIRDVGRQSPPSSRGGSCVKSNGGRNCVVSGVDAQWSRPRTECEGVAS